MGENTRRVKLRNQFSDGQGESHRETKTQESIGFCYRVTPVAEIRTSARRNLENEEVSGKPDELGNR